MNLKAAIGQLTKKRAEDDEWWETGQGEEDLTSAVRHVMAEKGIVHPEIEDVVDALTAFEQQVIGEQVIGEEESEAGNVYDRVSQARRIERALSGLGTLTDWLTCEGVTDLLVNPNGDVYLDRGYGLHAVCRHQFTPEQLRAMAVELATQCGARLDDASPFADGVLTRLPRGVWGDALRIHVALSPPVDGGACISVRVLHRDSFSLAGLRDVHMYSREVEQVLEGLVAARRNILISGGTGTGKSTLLKALIDQCGLEQRLLIVEDTPELLPQHPNHVKLVTRRANADGSGEIAMRDLMKQALRMRPDRVVIGEVRGAEIADLLVALNTGHAGSAGTIHANSTEAVPGRLMALGAMAGMSPAAVAQQVTDGVEVVLHLERTAVGRRLAQISTFSLEDGALHVRTVWDGEPCAGWEEFVRDVACLPTMAKVPA